MSMTYEEAKAAYPGAALLAMASDKRTPQWEDFRTMVASGRATIEQLFQDCLDTAQRNRLHLDEATHQSMMLEMRHPDYRKFFMAKMGCM